MIEPEKIKTWKTQLASLNGSGGEFALGIVKELITEVEDLQPLVPSYTNAMLALGSIASGIEGLRNSAIHHPGNKDKVVMFHRNEVDSLFSYLARLGGSTFNPDPRVSVFYRKFRDLVLIELIEVSGHKTYWWPSEWDGEKDYTEKSLKVKLLTWDEYRKAILQAPESYDGSRIAQNIETPCQSSLSMATP